MTCRIFVYGTLKRGGSNHSLLAGQRFVGTARTEPKFKLLSLGEYPGLVAAPKDGRSIEGEIWEVDPTCLVCLDALEGRNDGLYSREKIPLLPPYDTLDVQGYVYLLDTTGRPDLGENWPVQNG